MKLLELQKIDFLLKKANNHSLNTNPHHIIFSMNGNVYTGDFIPKINHMTIVVPVLDSLDSANKREIELKDMSSWLKISKSKTGIFDDSDFYKLISRSSHNDQTYYLQLVIELFKKYPIEFEETLPNYIYNVKSFSSESSFELPIIQIEENTHFDFVSITPIKTL